MDLVTLKNSLPIRTDDGEPQNFYKYAQRFKFENIQTHTLIRNSLVLSSKKNDFFIFPNLLWFTGFFNSNVTVNVLYGNFYIFWCGVAAAFRYLLYAFLLLLTPLVSDSNFLGIEGRCVDGENFHYHTTATAIRRKRANGCIATVPLFMKKYSNFKDYYQPQRHHLLIRFTFLLFDYVECILSFIFPPKNHTIFYCCTAEAFFYSFRRHTNES